MVDFRSGAFARRAGLARRSSPRICDAALARATTLRRPLEAVAARRRSSARFAPFDALYKLIKRRFTAKPASSPKPIRAPEIRAAAEHCIERALGLRHRVSLSRPIYDRLVAHRCVGRRRATRFALTRALDDYRRAGVDRDEATRARVTRAAERRSPKSASPSPATFATTSTRSPFAQPPHLAGLPADYIASHPPGADGLIHINTQSHRRYPDPELRARDEANPPPQSICAYRNRAYPAERSGAAQSDAATLRIGALLGRAELRRRSSPKIK